MTRNVGNHCIALSWLARFEFKEIITLFAIVLTFKLLCMIDSVYRADEWNNIKFRRIKKIVVSPFLQIDIY